MSTYDKREGTFDKMSGSDTTRSPAGTRLVTGLYRTPEDAERVYKELRSQGYTPKEISVLMSEETRKQNFGSSRPGQEFADQEKGNKAVEGMGVGSVAGGTLGAIVAGIAAIGSNLIIPGLGLVVAGPLAAALAGAGAGGAIGGLIGALVGAGIPEDRAREYDQGIRGGGIVLGAHARDDQHATELERHFTSTGASNVRT